MTETLPRLDVNTELFRINEHLRDEVPTIEEFDQNAQVADRYRGKATDEHGVPLDQDILEGFLENADPETWIVEKDSEREAELRDFARLPKDPTYLDLPLEHWDIVEELEDTNGMTAQQALAYLKENAKAHLALSDELLRRRGAPDGQGADEPATAATDEPAADAAHDAKKKARGGASNRGGEDKRHAKRGTRAGVDADASEQEPVPGPAIEEQNPEPHDAAKKTRSRRGTGGPDMRHTKRGTRAGEGSSVDPEATDVAEEDVAKDGLEEEVKSHDTDPKWPEIDEDATVRPVPPVGTPDDDYSVYAPVPPSPSSPVPAPTPTPLPVPTPTPQPTPPAPDYYRPPTRYDAEAESILNEMLDEAEAAEAEKRARTHDTADLPDYDFFEGLEEPQSIADRIRKRFADIKAKLGSHESDPANPHADAEHQRRKDNAKLVGALMVAGAFLTSLAFLGHESADSPKKVEEPKQSTSQEHKKPQKKEDEAKPKKDQKAEKPATPTTSAEQLDDAHGVIFQTTKDDQGNVISITEKLIPGGSDWKAAEKALELTGMDDPGLYDIDQLKDQILTTTGETETSARKLPVGYELTFKMVDGKLVPVKK